MAFQIGEGATPPRILHAGCGGAPLPDWMPGIETRLDIDPNMRPDIVASITDVGDIGPFEAVLCSHCVEHLHPREVHTALSEFHRVLRSGGVAIIIVPDLEGILPTDDVVYESPSGPVTGHDMYYGHKSCVENVFMQHHSGFIAPRLQKACEDAGFANVATIRDSGHNLIAVAVKA